MRPLRLDMAGFTVFRDPTTVDLTDADFFVLVGPTGSGKSTVLDAICFALYGTVPRWDDRRSIEHALSPSATEARVRLVFEAAGARFVATRVVRRDGKGKVWTAQAGLEQLPAGFDLSTFDLAPAQRGAESLGTVLAGTPTEMDAAVQAAVGLPYEQFTSSVMLPQGAFARFLHAKPKERQDILVNLLGLHVYRRIGERAGLVQREAEAAASATRSLLGDVSGADDASLATAEQEMAAAHTLVEAVEGELPALIEASAAGAAAQADLTRLADELARLSSVRLPAAVATLGSDAAAARQALELAEAEVLAAEERDEKLRAELAAAGDRATLQRVVDGYGEQERLNRRVAELAQRVHAVSVEHARVAAGLAEAQDTAGRATAAAQDALAGIEAAQTADRAASLRAHLVAGAPCPVCEQEVLVVPAMPATPALTSAKRRHAEAEKAAKGAAAIADRLDTALRQLDRDLAAVGAQHEESVRRLDDSRRELAAAGPLAAVRGQLQSITKSERAVEAGAAAVRDARGQLRRATGAARSAQDRLRGAWREFDLVRDGLAGHEPPSPDRDDLAGSWQALHVWAAAVHSDRTAARATLVARAESALAAITERVARLDEQFSAAGVPAIAPTTEAPAYRQAAALAAQRRTAAHQRVVELREQATRLAEQVARYERQAQVAKALALHLRADRFERWLLAEALDALVTGASRILRELSGGQYDLAHDKGEFHVVDHADAGLRRGVRTLSGGETFQASLALALALSEQLAGLSSTSASLESIMLDEGFGTLDTTTLDLVAATLENLAARGDRLVGVVTHVPALAERIPVRFEVSKDARGVAHIERLG